MNSSLDLRVRKVMVAVLVASGAWIEALAGPICRPTMRTPPSRMPMA